MLAWIALACSVIGLVLNARKDVKCWPIWCLASVCWIIYAMAVAPQPVLALTNFTFLAFNINGWIAWHNDAKKRSWLRLQQQGRAKRTPQQVDNLMNGRFAFGTPTKTEIERDVVAPRPIAEVLHDPTFDLASKIVEGNTFGSYRRRIPRPPV